MGQPSVPPSLAESFQVRCAGCCWIITLEPGLTEFSCPKCQMLQMLPPELMGSHQPPAAVHGVDPTKIQLPCAQCEAILNVPHGLSRFTCPLCGIDLAVDLSKLPDRLASPSWSPPTPEAPEQVDEMADVDPPPPPSPDSKKGRGKAKLGFKRKMKKGEKISVELYKGQVVGDNQSRMSSTVGQIAKDCKRFPVNASSFADIPESTFRSVYEELKDIFDMPPYDDIYRWLHHTLLQRWKAHRYLLKVEHFDPYTTTKDRFVHCPEDVDSDQWQSIVRYWESEDFQVISERNKRNRAKLVALSTSGNTTHTNKFYKLKQKERKSPPRVRNWKLNHTRKDGKPVNEATGELMKQINKQLAEGSQESTGRDDVLSKVLGTDSRGHVRGFGGAVTPESVFGPSSSRGGGQEYHRLREEVDTLREGHGTMMKEIERMKMLIAQLTGTMPSPPQQ